MAKETISGYRLQRHLVTGQTSQVWEVVEESSGRHFAMKLLLPEFAKDSGQRKFLFHEAEVGEKLAHPNIIKIVKVNRTDSNPNFVMEFFPSGNMKVRIRGKEEEFIREHGHDILRQAATGLAFMNGNGWVHRDVKPDNILVSSAADVRIIDFAISQKMKTGFFAKLFHSKKKTQGTRSYMAPEQIRGQLLDARADIYSFGITCYELVVGKPPFHGASANDLLAKHFTDKPVPPSTHNPSVTRDFNDLILKMLEKKKENRPENFHEILIALRGMKLFKPME